MKLLVTGHLGYLGVEMTSRLLAAGHEVVGLDVDYYADCDFVAPPDDVPNLRTDLRDVEPAELEGFDAVIHLAALSNDPLVGPEPASSPTTSTSTRRCGSPPRRRKRACRGSSSPRRAACTAPEGASCLDENAAFNPVTPYGESKVRVEQALSKLADDSLHAGLPAERHRVRRRRAGSAPTSWSTTWWVTR